MKKPSKEDEGELIAPNDETICVCIEAYTYALDDIAKLIERIQTEGISHLSIDDFFPSLEMLYRDAFCDWAEDIEDLYGWASIKRQIEHRNVRSKYIRKVYALAAAIEKRAPTNQNARTLSAAIRRINYEISETIDRAVCNYYHGKGIPQARDLLSDERHGALCDAVENAILSLSADSSDKMQGVEKRITALEGRSEAAQIEEDKQRQVEEAQALVKQSGKLGAAAATLRKDSWKGRGFNSPKGKNGKPYKDPEGTLRKQLV